MPKKEDDLVITLRRIEKKIDSLFGLVYRQGGVMAGELDALATQVQANADAEASAVVVLTQLHDMLVAAGTDPAKLNALKDQLSASKDALASAIVANTPAA